MEFIFGLVVIWGLFEGTKAIAAETRSAFQRGWSRIKSDGTVATGARAASGVATVAFGLPTIGREFGRGFGTGWRKARTRHRQRRADSRNSNTSALVDPPDHPLIDRPVYPPDPPHPRQRRGESAYDLFRVKPDKSREAPEPPRPQPTSPPANPTAKGPSMPIETTTGGEVLTKEQLERELAAIRREAVAEIDDARGDRRRATEDLRRIELMVASLQSHTVNMDQATIDEVSALQEPAQSRITAAMDRERAAETRLALVDVAVSGFQSRHQLMAEAHQATPHAANKLFYTG